MKKGKNETLHLEATKCVRVLAILWQYLWLLLDHKVLLKQWTVWCEDTQRVTLIDRQNRFSFHAPLGDGGAPNSINITLTPKQKSQKCKQPMEAISIFLEDFFSSEMQKETKNKYGKAVWPLTTSLH